MAGFYSAVDRIELIDREFIASIKENRAPNGDVNDVLSAMETLDRIERSFSI